MQDNYVAYHVHTELSLLDSCTNYKAYVDKAVELGQTAIAFTEHGNTYHWIEKKMYCDKKSIKYIHGVECYLTATLDEKVRDNYHTVLLAKNYEGLKEINLLIDKSTQPDHFYYKPRITFDEFLSISDNVIKISACLLSPLNHFPKDTEVYRRLCEHYDYYEVQPHVNSDAQKEYNKYLVELALQYHKPLIAGTDTHSINQYKAECRSIIQKAKGIIFTDEDTYDLTYKSYDELVEMFERQGVLERDTYMSAIKNTVTMADSVEEFQLDTSFKYPPLYDDEETVFKQRIYRMLNDKVERGIIKDPAPYKQNIKEEFKVFKKINMIGFMLFMSELICWCWDNDIPVGFCRGSVGGSTTAYITDITDVDPVVWNTVFSRFANEDRMEIGDIDVDISPSQRSLVYQHIIEQFTPQYTAYILAINTLKDKGAIDEIGRALKYPLDKVAHIKAEYESNPDKAKANYPELFYYFDGIVNIAVAQSMHPAGIVVSPVSLPDNYGTFWNDGKRILSIDMEEVHEVSLVKYDILGLKNIEIISKTCQYAGIPYPKSYTIDWNDKAVWADLITSPCGIFQFEGDYAYNLLKGFVPTCVNDLSLVNASLRPSGASYRDRLLARIPNQNPSILIDDLLKDNNGYLVFQEDTIKFLKDICGLSGSDADNVRRAIGRKQTERLQAALPQILEGYCSKSTQPREVAEEEARTFLQIIEDSSNYQFGLNHSTGYSMIGYTCAYLRYYYPAEFITAYLNCANNSDDIQNGVELSKLKHIPVHNIQFGKSLSDYVVDKDSNSIYKGIASIKFCNNKIAEELYQLSSNKYDSFIELLDDINSKTSVDARQLKILTGLNFFSQYGKNKYLLEIIEIYNKFRHCRQINKSKLESLGLTEYTIMKYSGKETAAQYREIDNMGLIHELSAHIPNKSMGVIEQVKFEKEYLEYVTYVNEQANEEYYIIINFNQYKDVSKPYFVARNIKTGQEIRSRIKQGSIFKNNPFSEYSVLRIKEFSKQFKQRLVDGKWTSTDEVEDILVNYEVIK